MQKFLWFQNNLSKIKKTNNKDEIETIRRKVINWEKRDKTGQTKVPCKLVVTYSSFKERRDRILFEKKLRKAKEAIQNDTEPVETGVKGETKKDKGK